MLPSKHLIGFANIAPSSSFKRGLQKRSNCGSRQFHVCGKTYRAFKLLQASSFRGRDSFSRRPKFARLPPAHEFALTSSHRIRMELGRGREIVSRFDHSCPSTEEWWAGAGVGHGSRRFRFRR